MMNLRIVQTVTVVLSAVLCWQQESFALRRPTFSRRVVLAPQRSTVLYAGGGSDSVDAVVVGVSGGSAESLICKIASSGGKVTGVLDAKPCSPVLASLSLNEGIKLIYGDFEDEQMSSMGSSPGKISRSSLKSMIAGKVVIVADDPGYPDERLKIDSSMNAPSVTNAADEMIRKFTANVLPNTVKAVITSANVGKTGYTSSGPFSGVFGRPMRGHEILKKWCDENKVTCNLVRYGSLLGGIPGAEPIPFKGLPLQEPELDQSYVLLSVVLTDPKSKQYADSEVCTRDSLAESMMRLASYSDLSSAGPGSGVDTLAISIAGPKPTEKTWSSLFSRLTISSDVELLRIDFGSIQKPKQFANWLVDQWFPQALIEADAATILSGARPVRATRSAEATDPSTGAMTTKISVAWEDVLPDLTVKPAGALLIQVVSLASDGGAGAGATAGVGGYVTVSRASTGGPLPGEAQLLDNLLEGVNKNAFKKKFCVPLAA